MVLKPFHWYLLLFAMTVTILTFSIVMAWLAGASLWLDQIPWGVWLGISLLTLAIGLILGGVSILRLEINLIRHIYRAANSSPALSRLVFPVYAQQETALRHSLFALTKLTDHPIDDSGVCKTCGSKHPGLWDQPWNGNYHAEHCVVPYARLLIGKSTPLVLK